MKRVPISELGPGVDLLLKADEKTKEIYIVKDSGTENDLLFEMRQQFSNDMLCLESLFSCMKDAIKWARSQGYFVRALISDECEASKIFCKDTTIPLLVNLGRTDGVYTKRLVNQEVLSIFSRRYAIDVIPLCNAFGDNHEAIAVDSMHMEIPETLAIITAWLSEESIKSRFLKQRALRMIASRWKDIDGVANFRDASMEHFPQGLLYRSADLSGLTDKGLTQLSRYVHTIIDVRSMPEIRRNGTIGPLETPIPDAQLERHDIVRRHVPIFKETDYSPEAIAHRHGLYKNGSDGFVEAYRGILEHCDTALNAVLTALIGKSIKKNDRRGVLVHCSAGKDRTGILCALVLLYAGVSAENVASEYELTTLGLAGKKRAILESLSKPGADLGDKAQVESMMSSPKLVMLKSIAVMEAEFGGVDAIVKRSGISDADLLTFREYTAKQSSVRL